MLHALTYGSSDSDDDEPLKKIQKKTDAEDKDFVEEGRDSSSSSSDDDDTSSDEDYDNPDRLWCICRQPHNNRYNALLAILHTLPYPTPDYPNEISRSLRGRIWRNHKSIETVLVLTIYKQRAYTVLV